MPVIEIEFGTPEYDESVALRDTILRKPLKMTFDPEVLAKEWADIHLGYYDNNFGLIGCLILSSVDEKTMKMRQVAVANRAQGLGIGKQLVQASEEKAAELGYKKMICHARETAIPFYDKLGYKIVGKPFTEVNIPHAKMQKTLK
jgi:N-acetylglutamate synthase-like GNAT family acetyltransferase